MTVHSLGMFWLARKRGTPPSHTHTQTNTQKTLNLPLQINVFYWTMLQILYMQGIWDSPNTTHVRLIPRTSVLYTSKLTIKFLLHQ